MLLPLALGTGAILPVLLISVLFILSKPAALFAVAAAVLIIAWPLSHLVRNRPEDYAQHPDGVVPDQVIDPESRLAGNSDAVAPDFTWRESIRSRAFWLIAMGHASSAMLVLATMTHLGMFMIDRGFSPIVALQVALVQSAVSVPFTLLGGVVGDRVPIRLALFAFSLLLPVAVGIILMSDSSPMFFLFSILMGIGIGGRMPLTIAILGTYFGRRNFATIYGISTIPMNIALSVAVPYVACMWASITGSYVLPMATLAAVSAGGSTLCLMLGNQGPSPSQRAAATAGAD